MALIDLLSEQRSCPRCNICKWIPIEKYAGVQTQAACPAIEKYQFHSYSAGGKQHLSIGINEGKIPVDSSVADIVYKCHFCGACEYSCKVYRPDMDVSETFDELRITCVENNVIPEEHKKMMENLAANDDCYGRFPEERIAWEKRCAIKTIKEGQTGSVFVYAGVGALYDEKQAQKTADIASLLISKGFDLVTAGSDEANSGYEAFVLGHIEAGKACAARVKEQLELSGAKTILLMDTHAFGTMRNYYPKYGYGLGVEIKHITQVFAQLIESGNLTFTKEFNEKVTYQDPCYLGRRSDPYKPPFKGSKDARPVEMSRTGLQGIYDEPRAVIRAVPGINFVEMDRIRGYAWCCGGGAGVSQAYLELAQSTSQARICEAQKTGAKFLVTACSNCEHVLRAAAKEDLEILDILDLVLEKGGAR